MSEKTDHLVKNDGYSEEQRWQAVLTRDGRYDGEFVYGVRSTGIYCRPICPSRRPQRKQAVFFPVPELAERAGFRPCRRCDPHLSRSSHPQLEMARRICTYIEDHSENLPTLRELGSLVGVSQDHLHRVFKRIMGITPRQYANSLRVDNFKANVKNGASVTDALYETGFGSSSRLYEQSPDQLGMTPGAYRRGGPGLEISYTILESPLGLLLVAATEIGICFISLGDDEAALESALEKEYPASEIRKGETPLTEWTQAILRHLSGQLPHLDLPTDLRATAFERLVWEQLNRIPYGETRSYSDIAAAIRRPKGARAVARACAANPVPLLIPCHRVVRKDGDVGGYRWGNERKEALLEQERNLSL